MVRRLRGKQDLIVDALGTVGTKVDGNNFVRIGGKVFAAVADAVLLVSDIQEGTVETQFAMVVLDRNRIAVNGGILDAEGCECLIVLAVMALDMQLEGISESIVFGKERLADFWNPKCEVSIRLWVKAGCNPLRDQRVFPSRGLDRSDKSGHPRDCHRPWPLICRCRWVMLLQNMSQDGRTICASVTVAPRFVVKSGLER